MIARELESGETFVVKTVACDSMQACNLALMVPPALIVRLHREPESSTVKYTSKRQIGCCPGHMRGTD